MSRVLVTDDEQRYRDHLARALSADGHDVLTAANGREAVVTGTHFHPHILVADWMLKHHVHGLQVSEVLQAVFPEMQTILITGFPSNDLRNEARRLHVSRFIEKPFELIELRDAVRAAAHTEPTPRETPPIAVIEVNRQGDILAANPPAQNLVASSVSGSPARHLDEVFDFPPAQLLTAAAQRWVTAELRCTPPLNCRVRARPNADKDRWILVPVPESHQYQMIHSAVQMILDLPPRFVTQWPLEGHALIIDRDETVGRVIAAQIEHAGGICHVADDPAAALRTCERDGQVDVVVIDDYLLSESIFELVEQLRALRPGIRVVGTSGSYRAREFEHMGVNDFLIKPWTLRDLLNLLLDRIGSCVDCGLPLPLRRPQTDENPGRWVCAGCGCRYSAVLDETSAEDVVRNVHPAEGREA